MKKPIVYLCLLFFAVLNAQVLPPGTYLSDIKNQKLKLNVDANNNFEMIFLYGKLSKENDTIYFKKKNKNYSNFKITPVSNTKMYAKLQLEMSYEMTSYYKDYTYLGIQKDNNLPIEYHKLSDFIKEDDSSYENKKSKTIEVDKCKYLYLVDASDEKTEISKFEINPSNTTYKIGYDKYSVSSLNLLGYFDVNNNLVVSDGKPASNALFTFSKPGQTEVEDSEIKPILVEKDSNWAKKNNFTIEDTAYPVDSTSTAYSDYKFVHSKFKNYQEALKSIVDKDKLLVLVVDYSKNGTTSFDSFVAQNQQTISNSMYSGYKKEYDNYNYFLATKSEQKLVSKYLKNNESGYIVLNQLGDVLYFNNQNINDDSYAFEAYGKNYDYFKKANATANLDKLLKNKKAILNDYKNALSKITSFFEAEKTADYAVAPPIPVLVEETSNHGVDATKLAKQATTTVDTAVAAADYDSQYNYDSFKNIQNLYKLKSSKELVYAKWKEVFDSYSNKPLDSVFVSICKKEINATGFSNALFNIKNGAFLDNEKQPLNYLINNYVAILADEKKQELSIDYSYDDKISNILDNYFSNLLSDYSNTELKDKSIVLPYYKRYLTASSYNTNQFSIYLDALNTLGKKENYYNEYNDYFIAKIKNGYSILENLDANYTAEASQNDWQSYKTQFSDLANNVAWDVVENSTDKAQIEKAIVWSEASIKIAPTSYYALDTLAQLYYKNDEKERAIITEQAAIDGAIKNEDLTSSNQYKEVLFRMKNRTY